MPDREAEQQEILTILRQAWRENPEQRLLQLIDNVIHTSHPKPLQNIFFVEDQAFEDALKLYITNQRGG